MADGRPEEKSFRVYRDSSTWHLRKVIIELWDDRREQIIERSRCFLFTVKGKKRRMLRRADKIRKHWERL
jgi:hypothetical protein